MRCCREDVGLEFDVVVPLVEEDEGELMLVFLARLQLRERGGGGDKKRWER